MSSEQLNIKGVAENKALMLFKNGSIPKNLCQLFNE